MPVLKFWNPRTRRHEPVSGPVGIMGDAPGARVSRDTVQSVASGAVTAYSWSRAVFDSHGFWSAVAPTRLTVPAGMAGRYLWGMQEYAISTAANQLLVLYLYVNGVVVPGSVDMATSIGAGTEMKVSLSLPVVLAVGDYVEGMVYHNIANPRDVGAAGPGLHSPMMWLTKEAVGQPGPQGPRGPGVMGTVIRRVYTSIGTTTWTKPEGLHHIEVECQGGGGGAGGASQNIPPGAAVSGGGGGGGYARSVLLAAELPASCAVVVGGGGAGGWSGDGPGSPGAHSTFSGTGVNVAGYGAAGGAASGQGNGWAVVPGGGGGSGVGQLIVIGSDAPVGWVVTMDGGTYSPTGGPHGGASHLGGARQGTMNGNGVVGYAGGGGGGPVIGWAVISHYSGGAGGQGVVIVTEHYG